MTMFEMIDELEPIIPEREMRKYYNGMQYNWRYENPEAYKLLYTKYNQRKSSKKEDDNERMGTDRG